MSPIEPQLWPLRPFGAGKCCSAGAGLVLDSCRPLAEGEGLPSTDICFFWNRGRGPALPGPSCRPKPEGSAQPGSGFWGRFRPCEDCCHGLLLLPGRWLGCDASGCCEGAELGRNTPGTAGWLGVPQKVLPLLRGRDPSACSCKT
jgi:hypothetical protein